jgi:hypothetical protein
MIGILPYPASYQTPEALMKAFHTVLDYVIANDPCNSEYGLTAKDILTITYDESTSKYLFECGPKAVCIVLTMGMQMARLFGIDHTDETPVITMAIASRRDYDADEEDATTEKDMVWARTGHRVVSKPWMDEEETRDLPVAVRSTFPVTPGLSTQNMYIKCDLIDSRALYNGSLDNTLATVTGPRRPAPLTRRLPAASCL